MEKRQSPRSFLGRRFYQRLGKPVKHHVGRDGRRGLIILQVDGLSMPVLANAMRRRFMPFMNKLVHKKQLILKPVRAGLPATTPAVQLALLYGMETAVPGFRWFERETGRFMIMKGVDDCAEVENRVSAGRRGILQDGVSYSMLFSGGAAESVFTASRVGSDRYERRFTVFEILILMLLNIRALLRIAGLSFLELWSELWEDLKVRRRGGLRRQATAFTLVRIFSNVVLRELSTVLAVIDIHRGVPSIFINYFGYDELSHHRGPTSLIARLSLRGIDAQIKRIWKAANKVCPDGYDICVLSDHGQVPTIPFGKKYGTTLGDHLSGALLRMRVDQSAIRKDERRISRAIQFINYLNSMRQVLPESLGRLADRLVRKLESGMAGVVEEKEARELGSVYVLPTSDMAHIYFNDGPARHTIEQLEAAHTGAAAAIIDHPGILLAAGVSEEGVVLVSRSGMTVLDPATGAILSGPDRFDGLPLSTDALADVARLVSAPDSGDLVVFARRHGMRVVNFQEELGGHGGLYPEEQDAFLAAPQRVQSAASAVKPEGVLRPADLYQVFKSYAPENRAVS